MIRDIINFFKQEKLYGLIFITLIAIYAYATLLPKPVEESPLTASAALEEFRTAEMKLQTQFRGAGSWETFASQQPVVARIFQGLAFFASGVFSLGLVINLLLFVNPTFRRHLNSEIDPGSFSDWKLSMVFKFLMLFMSSSLALSFIVASIHKYLLPDVSVNFFLLLQTTIVDLSCFGIIAMILWRAGGKLQAVGFRVPRSGWLREVGYGIAGYVTVYPLFVVVLVFLIIVSNFLAFEPPPHPLVSVFLEEGERSSRIIIYSILVGTLVGPVFEEMFFRGFCYPIFKKRWGSGVSMVVTSMFFASIHQNIFAFWPIFVLGVGLNYLYEKRKCLIGPIVLHVVHNTVFISYFFLAKRMVAAGAGG
ncbi:MAG: CPBP family intramembrane metalloprotease [Candidatus Omnitrophota bacterium]|nr:CPBP family intramembrane metalloprotease [Candidatus Omnitrophota bacterium]